MEHHPSFSLRRGWAGGPLGIEQLRLGEVARVWETSQQLVTGWRTGWGRRVLRSW